MFENWNRFIREQLQAKAEREAAAAKNGGAGHEGSSKGSKTTVPQGMEPAKPGEGKRVSGPLLGQKGGKTDEPAGVRQE